MPELPASLIESPTIEAIYAAIKATEGPRRGYLGASNIGHGCERFLWLSFRHAGGEDFDGRMLRLFETGHIEEGRLIENLRAAGLEVWDKDPNTGQQFEIVDHGGHFRGHADGVCLGVIEAPKTPHLLECKTSSLKLFEKLKAEGVAVAKPMHVAQMQVYMHYMHLDRALYIAICKDDERIYVERINYDKAAAQRLVDRAARIITATEPPARIADSRDAIPCKWCCFADVCWGAEPPASACASGHGCRSCVHVTPVVGALPLGQWRCERFNKTLSESEQAAGCSDHLVIPDLLAPAFEVVDGSVDENWTQYRNDKGKTFKNGNRPDMFKTVELTQIPWPLVSDPMIEALKNELGAEVVKDYNE